ncbi:MAG TPA: hypothetical protein VK063_05325 [Beutenbergiaceae bacterium]|nr:hypothetical protein [Beutenbergiaceae bacterium]
MAGRRTAGLDVRWLSAAETDVEAAITDKQAHEPPRWAVRRTSLAGYLSLLLQLWYLAVVWVTLSIRVDNHGGWRASDLLTVAITMGIFILWSRGTARIFERAANPTHAEQVRVWRSNLVAKANGFEADPVRRARFSSLITGERGKGSCFPRFTASGVEFGNLRSRDRYGVRWHYLTVRLPEPLPHLILDATTDGPLPRELPRPAPDQQILHGGTFERSFRVFAPRAYETDAMFLLTPEVMAGLADHAAGFNVEIRDTNVVFFTRAPADFTDPATWRTVDRLLRDAVPAVVARARRYRDLDVPHADSETQEAARRRAAYEAELEKLGAHWLRGEPSIGPVGKRLRMHTPRITWPKIRQGLRNVGLFVVFVTPFSVAFGGFISAIVGR